MVLVKALIDAGPIVAYYNSGDDWHAIAKEFLGNFKGQLLTTESVITEVMWLLSADWQVQNEFLRDLKIELYQTVSLVPPDFQYIAELNENYNDVPGDFGDLSLVAISQRLQLRDIVSLDSDFDIYRGYGGKIGFNQLFPKYDKRKR